MRTAGLLTWALLCALLVEEQVDYVYFAQDQVLSPAQVQAAVSGYRTAGVTFEDTV